MTSSYHDAKRTPGTAEFLATLLTGPYHSCPHSKKIEPGIGSKIPARLGFFHADDEELSYLDTSKLCRECYDKAVPEGFSTWSTFYLRANAANPTIDNPVYPMGEPTQGGELYFPRQLQAGTERFDDYHRSDGQLPGDVPKHTDYYPQKSFQKALDRLGHFNYDGIHYERRFVGMPQNPETVEAWKYMKWARKPFFIDLLHTNPPWRGNLPPKEQMKEDRRIAHANGAAYLGAQWVVTGVPEGGSGPYTTSEHRIAELGAYRLLPIGQYRQDKGNVRAHSQSSRRSSSNTAGVQLSKVVSLSEPISKALEEAREQQRATWNAREVDPRYYGPDLGKGYFRLGSFQYYPSSEIVDKVTKEAVGRKLKPTEDEKLRRQYESELPEIDDKKPAIFLREQSSPPQKETLQSSKSHGFLQRLGFGRQSRSPSASTTPYSNSTPFTPTTPYPANHPEPVASARTSVPKESSIPQRPVREADLDQPYRIPIAFSKASSGSAAQWHKVSPEGQLTSVRHGNEYQSNVYAKKPFRRHKPLPSDTPSNFDRNKPGPWEWTFAVGEEEEGGIETKPGNITQKERKVEVKKPRPEGYKTGSGSMPRYEEWQKSQRATAESKREEERERHGNSRRNDLATRSENLGSSSSSRKDDKYHREYNRESKGVTPSGYQNSVSSHRSRATSTNYEVSSSSRRQMEPDTSSQRQTESDTSSRRHREPDGSSRRQRESDTYSQRQRESDTSSQRQREPDTTSSRGNKEEQNRGSRKPRW